MYNYYNNVQDNIILYIVIGCCIP